MTAVIVQQTTAQQYIVTIPKKLAEAMNISKGQTVHWRVGGAGKLELLM